MLVIAVAKRLMGIKGRSGHFGHVGIPGHLGGSADSITARLLALKKSQHKDLGYVLDPKGWVAVVDAAQGWDNALGWYDSQSKTLIVGSGSHAQIAKDYTKELPLN